MYMPGRFRTASSPSRIWIEEESYPGPSPWGLPPEDCSGFIASVSIVSDMNHP